MHLKDHYNCVVVGGGIVGAGIFRDLALNGTETLLVDAGDFSSQTSQASSKMLHGGIRYLENMDFKLVFEALHEKNLWLKLAPHIAKERPFYLPVYNNSKRPLWMIRAGLFLYDALSTFKNSKFKIKSKSETLHDIKGLNPEGLKGAGLYYDGIMDDAKLTLEVIYDGLKAKHTEALNYTEVIDAKVKEKKTILTLADKLTGEKKEITATHVVYALGPFTDMFLKRFPQYHWNDVLLPSKGSHIWISKKDLPLEYPLVMTPHDEYGDRVIFIVPHQHKVLIGTTELQYNGDLFNVKINDEEINYLLKNLNSYFPKYKITREHILASFSGIRPLAKEDAHSNDRSKTSREHKIYRPAHDTYVIVGGKYTTFRVMGQSISQEISHKNRKSYNPDKSQEPLRQISVINSFDWHCPNEEELVEIMRTELPRTFNDLVSRRLSIISKRAWNDINEVSFDDYFLEKSALIASEMGLDLEQLRENIRSFN